MPFSYRITRDGTGATVAFDGPLDETARDPLFALKPEILAARHVVLDLGGVPRINSYGVMHWVQFLRALPAGTFEFVNCSAAFVEFVSMVPETSRDAPIRSFYGTVACAACDSETVALVAMPASGKPAVPACRKCGQPGQPMGFLEECLEG